MPFDRSLYPADWEAISQRVKDRAAWCCQWPGCGVKHGIWIARRLCNLEQWEECTERIAGEIADFGPIVSPSILKPAGPGLTRPRKVIITTSHRCYCVPICGDDTHLWALCQLHHLRFDTRQRVIAAAGTRRARDAEAGQKFLIPDIDVESPRRALRSLQERSRGLSTEETTS